MLEFFDEGLAFVVEKIFEFENEKMQGSQQNKKILKNNVSNLMGNDPELRSVRVEMDSISDEFNKQSDEYVASYYQVYIASRAVFECKPHYAFTLGSGQGKTTVAVMVARYF